MFRFCVLCFFVKEAVTEEISNYRVSLNGYTRGKQLLHGLIIKDTH